MSLAILTENLMRNQPAPRKKTSISITSSNKEILSFHLWFNFPMHLHSCFWIRNEIKWERRYMNKNCTSTRERQFPINSQILLILITIDMSINKTFFCPNKKKHHLVVFFIKFMRWICHEAVRELIHSAQ
jgi:hypothetical protein